jgi:hypothetical protein
VASLGLPGLQFGLLDQGLNGTNRQAQQLCRVGCAAVIFWPFRVVVGSHELIVFKYGLFINKNTTKYTKNFNFKD